MLVTSWSGWGELGMSQDRCGYFCSFQTALALLEGMLSGKQARLQHSSTLYLASMSEGGTARDMVRKHLQCSFLHMRAPHTCLDSLGQMTHPFVHFWNASNRAASQ